MTDFDKAFLENQSFLRMMAYKWGKKYHIYADDALATCYEAFWAAYQKWTPEGGASLRTLTHYYIMGRMSYLHAHEFKHMEEESVLDESWEGGTIDSTLDNLHIEMVRERLREAIDTYLTPTEAQVIKLYYWGEHESVRTIGKKLGYTPQRISQLIHKGLDKLHMVLYKEDFYDA